MDNAINFPELEIPEIENAINFAVLYKYILEKRKKVLQYFEFVAVNEKNDIYVLKRMYEHYNSRFYFVIDTL